MISILVYVLVLALVFGLVVWIVGQIPLPAPFGNIVLAIVGLIFVLLLLGILLGGIPMQTFRLQ